MGEVPLARLWQLPDGTACLLLKDSRAATWQVRVIRDGATIRTESFRNAIVAMDEAKQWRASFDPSVSASNESPPRLPLR